MKAARAATVCHIIMGVEILEIFEVKSAWAQALTCALVAPL